MAEVADLRGFTSKEKGYVRYKLDEPWRRSDGRGCATDGCIAIILDDGSEFGEPEDRVPDLDSVFASFDRMAARVAMPKIEGPPEGADPWWDTGAECDICCGKGGAPCPTCNRLEDSEACHGSGRCGGEEWDCLISGGTIKVLGRKFDRRYAWTVSKLPGVTACFNSEHESLDFVFAGGIGRLKPFSLPVE